MVNHKQTYWLFLRLHNIPRGMVIIFYGFCNIFHEKVCWASFGVFLSFLFYFFVVFFVKFHIFFISGITEQLIIVNDALICLSFIFRLHATTKLPPPSYVTLCVFKQKRKNIAQKWLFRRCIGIGIKNRMFVSLHSPKYCLIRDSEPSDRITLVQFPKAPLLKLNEAESDAIVIHALRLALRSVVVKNVLDRGSLLGIFSRNIPEIFQKIFVAVAVVVCFTLATSVGYYRLLDQGRAYASSNSTTDEQLANFTNVPFISGNHKILYNSRQILRVSRLHLRWNSRGAKLDEFRSRNLLRFSYLSAISDRT